MLKLLTIIKVAMQSIGRNKLRSGLTALGLIIGVACVIAKIGVGRGAQSAVQSHIAALGSIYFMVFPGIATQSGARIWGADSRLTEEDALAVREECASVAYVSPRSRMGAQIVAGNQNCSTQVEGVGVDWPFIRSWNFAEGAFCRWRHRNRVARDSFRYRVGADLRFQRFADGEAGSVVRRSIDSEAAGQLLKASGQLLLVGVEVLLS